MFQTNYCSYNCKNKSNTDKACYVSLIFNDENKQDYLTISAHSKCNNDFLKESKFIKENMGTIWKIQIAVLRNKYVLHCYIYCKYWIMHMISSLTALLEHQLILNMSLIAWIILTKCFYQFQWPNKFFCINGSWQSYGISNLKAYIIHQYFKRNSIFKSDASHKNV